MNAFAPMQLQRAVMAICPDIANRASAAPKFRDERRLWWELSCCLLSSQVPYALAAAASDRIEESGLLISPCADQADLGGGCASGEHGVGIAQARPAGTGHHDVRPGNTSTDAIGPLP